MVLLKYYCHNINVYVVPVFTGRCTVSITVPMRHMAWVCGQSLAGIVGLNLLWGMDVCFLCALCIFR